ncbi:MAG: cation transporter [Desulfosarcina sp.]|nr:cation transporter [Desulfosarcina sp.]MBC2744984.1 cation transporter [Desulfosarcina sp.]MBC2767892.1 cation transporter [Desulfosarcina sp.]
MREIEQRSLNLAKWANLFMGVAGIVAAIGSHASALMLDGLFSGVNFLAAVLAARVAASIQQKPNVLRPFGYEIDEPMYVMFRSLVLTGVIISGTKSAMPPNPFTHRVGWKLFSRENTLMNRIS